jgi:hypothetical protein
VKPSGVLVGALAALALGLAVSIGAFADTTPTSTTTTTTAPPTPTAPVASWLPHSADASWTYQWTDSVYAQTPTSEQVTVKSTKGPTYTLAWTTDGLSNPADAVSSAGTADFQETNAGIVNTNWSSTPPPAQFPVLCAQASSCGNALSAVIYNVIWGSRSPVLAEPLIKGMTWTSTGGAANDVTSTSTYLGQSKVTVPAFTSPVTAAVIRSKITQAGALGDPYGSGTRTVWWVYGVGPVKIEFQHAGGTDAADTKMALQSTNLTALAPPSDLDYFPFTKNLTLKYSWTNTKHLKKPEVQKFTIDAVVNSTARFTVKDVSGPLKVAGSYGFSKHQDGVTSLWGTTQSATTLKFPPLGPAGAPPSQRNHFVTPFDLMNFGYDPILPANPAPGTTWTSVNPSNDFTTYHVIGKSTVLGLQKVTVPAGTFSAVAVRSQLKQPGYPYGSGTRTSWFAPGKGLVKLVFDHADGSVSTVELVK